MSVLWFILQAIFFFICASVVICIVIFIPLTIYVIPYLLWVGNEHTKGKHLDKKKEGVWKSTKHATHLYSCWIARKKPSF